MTAAVKGPARLVSFGPPRTGCASVVRAATTITCTLGALAPGAFASLRLEVEPLGRGNLTLTVSTTAAVDELDRTDNAVTEQTFVSRCSVLGTLGNDALRGRRGPDVICGLAGNDVIYARDGARDVIDGGPGVDTAYVDRFDLVQSVEHVHRIPVR